MSWKVDLKYKALTTEVGSFEKINKIDKSLVKLVIRREEPQKNNIKNENRDKTMVVENFLKEVITNQFMLIHLKIRLNWQILGQYKTDHIWLKKK